jgi:nucleotide-binding universal stress UspA family protein
MVVDRLLANVCCARRAWNLAGDNEGSWVAMYKTIVVGTDGSARAGIAVQEALALAKLTGATVHAVHAVHHNATTGFSDVMGASQFDASNRREVIDQVGVALLAEAQRQGVAAEMHVPEGDAADALIGVAESVDADLVVLGNRGMTGMARLVLGSVPNKVSHVCPCNVLIVNTDRT